MTVPEKGPRRRSSAMRRLARYRRDDAQYDIERYGFGGSGDQALLFAVVAGVLIGGVNLLGWQESPVAWVVVGVALMALSVVMFERWTRNSRSRRVARRRGED